MLSDRIHVLFGLKVGTFKDHNRFKMLPLFVASAYAQKKSQNITLLVLFVWLFKGIINSVLPFIVPFCLFEIVSGIRTAVLLIVQKSK